MDILYPTDELGRHLLQSIPRKIAEWLVVSKMDPDRTITMGKVVWTSDATGGTLTCDGKTILWVGPAKMPTSAGSNVQEFVNVSENLKMFVDFETEVYQNVEHSLQQIS